MEAKAYPANFLLLSLESKVHGLSPLLRTRGQSERKWKIFPPHSFLSHKLLVCGFLFVYWKEVRIEDREGERTSEDTVLGWPWDCGGRCKLGWRMARHKESLEILQQFSHPRQPRHSPVARTSGNQKCSQWEVMTAKKQADLIHRPLHYKELCPVGACKLLNIW